MPRFHSSYSRRQLIRSLGLGMACATLPELVRAADEFASQVEKLEKQMRGRIGLAALDTRDNRMLGWRATERFALCSTFKWLLAAQVMMQARQGKLSLTQRIDLRRSPLLDHAPFVRQHLHNDFATVEALCQAIVDVSDNTAANLLLNLIGGPAAYTLALRAQGDDITRLDRLEPALNSNLPDDPRDTTTPQAMLNNVQTWLLGDVMHRDDRDKLLSWMQATRTGLHRLRAGLPRSWRAADKTGTGENGAVNDVLIAWPPQRAPVLMSVYVSADLTLDAANAVHAQLGTLMVETFG